MNIIVKLLDFGIAGLITIAILVIASIFIVCVVLRHPHDTIEVRFFKILYLNLSWLKPRDSWEQSSIEDLFTKLPSSFRRLLFIGHTLTILYERLTHD